MSAGRHTAAGQSVLLHRGVTAFYEALVKNHTHENKYKFMIERIQNKFARFVYL